MEIVNTENAILKLEELGNIDPRLIVSMAVIGPSKISIAYLTDLVSLSKKAKIIIPGDNAAGTQIKSIQYLSGANIVVAETVRTMTPEARAVIKKMIQVMTYSQVTNAFFPGNMSFESSGATCFIGKTADDLVAVQKNIKNLRISRECLVFSDGDRVKKISLQDYKASNGFASNLFTTLLKADQEVKFLGRIKDWYVPVTLKDGTIAQLDVKSGKREPAVRTFDGVIKASAYIGEVFGGKHAVVSGNQLVTA